MADPTPASHPDRWTVEMRLAHDAAHVRRLLLAEAPTDGDAVLYEAAEDPAPPGGLTEAERESLWHAYQRWEEGDDFGEHMGGAVERILAARGGTAAAGDDHRQRADHYEHLYQQASEGKCGPSGLTIGACKASICDCFEFPWVKAAPDEHPDPAPTAAAGDEGLRAAVEGIVLPMGDPTDVLFLQPQAASLLTQLRAALDATPAPTKDPAPAQDTLPTSIGGTATVTGVVRTVQTLHPPGHYRITLDCPPAPAGPREWGEV